MGRALTRVISETSGAVLTGALEAPGSGAIGQGMPACSRASPKRRQTLGDLWSCPPNADGILDFTVPRAPPIANVAIAAERGIVHVIGTTGYRRSDDGDQERYAARHRGDPACELAHLESARRVQSLDEGFDIENSGNAPQGKIDAPSGTAFLLGEAAAAGRKIAPRGTFARGPRRPHRGAQEGRYRFASCAAAPHRRSQRDLCRPHERITLSHHAEDRMIFAHAR